MPRARLTQAFCDRALIEKNKVDPEAERIIFWDTSKDSPRGFGLVVMKNGHRSFCLQYRHRGVISRRMTIDTPELDAARKTATGFKGDISRGEDPVDKRRKEKAASTNTLKSIAENYLEREGRKLRSVKLRRSTFENQIFPVLGAMPIDTIRRSHINHMLDKVEDESGPVA